MSTTSNNAPSNRPAGGNGKLWRIVGAAVVLLAVVAGLLWRHHGNTPSQGDSSNMEPATSATPSGSLPTPSATVTVTATPTPSASSAAVSSWSDRGCNGHASDSQATGPQLSTTTWTPFLTAALPSTPTLGPVKVNGDVRECYAHSPAGAVMAAANYELGEFSTSAAKVIESRWTAGAGREQALSDAATSDHQPANLAGYSFAGCTPQRCNVQLSGTQGGQYTAGVLPLVWQDGDWFVDGSQTLPDGSLSSTFPTGFTQWGPAA